MKDIREDLAKLGKLSVYDIATDEFREATQRDIDALQITATAYGSLTEKIETILSAVMAWERSANPRSAQFAKMN